MVCDDGFPGIKDLKAYIERELVQQKYLIKVTEKNVGNAVAAKQSSSSSDCFARDGKVGHIALGEKAYGEIGIATMYDYLHKLVCPDVGFDEYLGEVFVPFETKE